MIPSGIEIDDSYGNNIMHGYRRLRKGSMSGTR